MRKKHPPEVVVRKNRRAKSYGLFYRDQLLCVTEDPVGINHVARLVRDTLLDKSLKERANITKTISEYAMLLRQQASLARNELSAVSSSDTFTWIFDR